MVVYSIRFLYCLPCAYTLFKAIFATWWYGSVCFVLRVRRFELDF